MALRKRGKHHYGDTHADIHTRLASYSAKSGYPALHYADARCQKCGGGVFGLALDEAEGAAVRSCAACRSVHPMADGADYLAGAALEECACPCGSELFELSVGVALYADSADVRWFYVGARCPACGLTACYGDWKLEGGDFGPLLART